MLKEEKGVFFLLLKEECDYYRKPNLLPAAQDAYWDSLCNYLLHDIKIALRKHRQDEKYGHRLPLVVDLKKHLPHKEKKIIERNDGCAVAGCPNLGTMGEIHGEWVCHNHWKDRNAPLEPIDYSGDGYHSDQFMNTNDCNSAQMIKSIRELIKNRPITGVLKPMVNKKEHDLHYPSGSDEIDVQIAFYAQYDIPGMDESDEEFFRGM